MQHETRLPLTITPVSMRTARKIRTIALRNFQVPVGSFDVRVMCDETVYVKRQVDSWELQSLTIQIGAEFERVSSSEFSIQVFKGGEIVLNLMINLQADSNIDLGPGLEAINLPAEPMVYVKLANGIWTTRGNGELFDSIGSSGSVAHIEPRTLTFSRMLEACRVISRLLETRTSLNNELASYRATIVSKHDIQSRRFRRLRIEKRRMIEVQEAINTSLADKISSVESRIFHKRTNLQQKQSELNRLKSSMSGPPLLAANLAALRTELEEVRLSKMSGLGDIFGIEKVSKSYTIRGLMYNKQVFDMRDEEGFSTALSYVIISLLVVSKLFDVPVRQGLVFCGSRSSIVDFVSMQELPLFYKDEDRASYSRAVELLHDAIHELLIHSGFTDSKRSPDLLSDLKRLLWRTDESPTKQLESQSL